MFVYYIYRNSRVYWGIRGVVEVGSLHFIYDGPCLILSLFLTQLGICHCLCVMKVQVKCIANDLFRCIYTINILLCILLVILITLYFRIDSRFFSSNCTELSNSQNKIVACEDIFQNTKLAASADTILNVFI